MTRPSRGVFLPAPCSCSLVPPTHPSSLEGSILQTSLRPLRTTHCFPFIFFHCLLPLPTLSHFVSRVQLRRLLFTSFPSTFCPFRLLSRILSKSVIKRAHLGYAPPAIKIAVESGVFLQIEGDFVIGSLKWETYGENEKLKFRYWNKGSK